MGSNRQKKGNFGNTFGVATMGLISVAASTLMMTMFMQYLTDYAGLGAWGAGLATVVLLVGRIIDAVNDPLQGWIIDNARVTRLGKYKRFTIYSTIMTILSVILLYNLPSGISSSPVLVAIWILLFYLIYDFGTSFYAYIPLIQSLSPDETQRSKYMAWNRIFGTIIAIPMASFITTAIAINNRVDDLHRSIGIAATAWILPIGLVSLAGLFMIKEGRHYEQEEGETAQRVTFRDIITLLKANKPLQVHALANVFFGFMWTLMFATNTYYIKWAYCADLATGAVDLDRLGTLSLVIGILMILPILLSAGMAGMLVKKLGSSVAVMKLSIWIAMVPGVILYVLQLVGVLQASTTVFLVLVGIMTFGVGLTFVPANTLWMECMDYNAFTTGKEMGGLISAVSKFLEKAQGAVSTVVIGGLLVAIGYNVDSVSGDYLGDMALMPQLLNSFILVAGMIPAILGIFTLLVYRKYPVTPELRAQMRASNEAKRAEATE